MKKLDIQIDGTNTKNKGAELMLVAILEQIACYAPQATVYYNTTGNLDAIKKYTDLDLKQRAALKYQHIPLKFLRKFKLPYRYFTTKKALDTIDVMLDASGFQFSDQWNYSVHRLDELEAYYKELKKNKTTIILLPQALGPFKTPAGKRMMEIVNKYVDVLIAREQISYDHAIGAGVSKEKVWCYTDFTALVTGRATSSYAHLEGGICIIPNSKMITHTAAQSSDYLRFLEFLINFLRNKGEKPFLLNHEGAGDLAICNEVNTLFPKRLEVINGLDAREVKDVIGRSSITISSRFHGVASALSQGVPCLATSWNHKYEMLFKDYGLEDMVLPLTDHNAVGYKLDRVLEDKKAITQRLKQQKELQCTNINEMWRKIWSLISG